MWNLPLFLLLQSLLPTPIYLSPLPFYLRLSVLLHPSTANQLSYPQHPFSHRVCTPDAQPAEGLGKVDFKSRP